VPKTARGEASEREDGDEDERGGQEVGGKGGGGERDADAKKEVFEKPRVSKRSMKKIKINGGNGTRVCNDENK
jgi:hypothetical protein